MNNGVDLLQKGNVSILVFDTAIHRKCIADLLANSVETCTRIAIAPDSASEEELKKALDYAREIYPLPEQD